MSWRVRRVPLCPSTIAMTQMQSARGRLNLPFVRSFVTFLCQNIPPWALGLSSGQLYDSDIPHCPVSHYSPCGLVFPIRSVDTPSSPHVFIFTICINSIPSYSCCWIHNQVDKFLFPFKRFSSLHIVGFWPFWFYPSIADIHKTYSFGNLLVSISDQAVFILHWDLVMMMFLSLLLIECI